MSFFTIGYFRGNLGDDLMVNILARKNFGKKFFLYSPNGLTLGNVKGCDNIGVVRNKFFDWFKCEGVVFIGGSLFQDYSNLAWRYYIKLYIFCCFSRLLGKDVFIFSSNLGPFNNKVTEYCVRGILKMARKTVVRDMSSFEYCTRYDISSVIDLDIVHKHYEIYSKEKARFLEPNKLLGVSVVGYEKWNTSTYIDNLVKHIVKLHDNFGFKVNLYSFCDDEDLELCKIVMNKVLSLKKIDIEIIRYESLEGSLSSISNCSYMICSRFHSVILAIKNNIPFDMFIYSNKTIDYLISHFDIKQEGFSVSEEVKENVHLLIGGEGFPDRQRENYEF